MVGADKRKRIALRMLELRNGRIWDKHAYDVAIRFMRKGYPNLTTFLDDATEDEVRELETIIGIPQ